jgi:hypothetical protein
MLRELMFYACVGRSPVSVRSLIERTRGVCSRPRALEKREYVVEWEQTRKIFASTRST